MEQREFDATQCINDACYELIRRGYTIKQVYGALSTVMDAVKPKPVSTLTIDLHVDTTELERTIQLVRDLHNGMDN